jgi:hypothetical protein
MEKKIKNYKVIQEEDLKQFEDLVEKALEEGWRPIGGVSVTQLAINLTRYHQAVVKNAE